MSDSQLDLAASREAAGRGVPSGPGAAQCWIAEGAPPRIPRCADALLEALFGLTPDRWLRRIGDRETFSWPGEGRWIVKRFRGGEARDWWHERLRGAARSSARREAENLADLGAEGFAVPRPLAWVEERAARRHPRRRGRSALVMERLGPASTGLPGDPDSAQPPADLRTRLATTDAEERARLLAELVELVAHFHGRAGEQGSGWIHRDLYLQHVLWIARDAKAPRSKSGRLYLIDLGRARPRATCGGERWLVKDLAALHLSAPAEVGAADRLRFLTRWLVRGEGRELRARALRSLRRTWALRVLEKARRLGAHRPRYLDPSDPVDTELFGEASPS